MTLEWLRQIAEAVGERRGWDFSRTRDDRDPVSWDYLEVACRYLRPSDRVLDVGTGGGERFLSLAPHFGLGVGIDASAAMVQVARENTPAELLDKMTYEVMLGEKLRFGDGDFDVVLNRHAPICPAEVARVLKPDGLFITQQVGPRNTEAFCQAFGCQPGGSYAPEQGQELDEVALAFGNLGCAVEARGEYNVRYYFLDLESFVFWLKAIPMPEDFDVERHWQQVDELVRHHWTPRGLESNEHRQLLVVRKARQ